MTKVRTRFAPSPTGIMHIGNVRAALLNFLFAKQNNGTFLLRIEDTDKEREVEGSIEHILKSLKWLGINWDEGPDIGGSHKPYLQSKRLNLYKDYAQKLIDRGLTYSDPYTEEEVEEFRKQAEKEKKPFLYREHRPRILEPWDKKRPLRFRVPEVRSYKWKDLVYGDLSAGPEALDDFILIKSDGYPTYNFAHIVDDIEMGVTHVMRGQEFISSTPKYLSVYEALGATPPVFATTPPVMSSEGKKKLGKRDGAKDVLEYQKEGYLPEAMMNFLALLGWNPGGEKEVFTKEELIKLFDLNKIQRSGGQFGDEKLDWLNKEHIKLLPKLEVEKNILTWLPKGMRNPKLVPVIMDRIHKWSDVKEMAGRGELDLFLQAPQIDKNKLIFKNTAPEKISENLKSAAEAMEKIPDGDFTEANIKNALMELAEKLPSRGELLHPVRYALSGLDKSPDPFIIASIIGKNETISRLQKAI